MRNISEVFVNGVCLTEVLEKHRKWLNGEDGGEKVDLDFVDLSDTNLRGADLRFADLRGTDLRGTDLRFANLSNADLRDVDLRDTRLNGANLSGANLSGVDLRFAVLKRINLSFANLRNADLSYTNLSDANLIGADLRFVDLNCANLIGTNLSSADLRGSSLNKVSYNHQTSFFVPICPEEGSFIGYKKADDKIVKLLIAEDSKRSSATTRKCRCSKAKVLSITNIENTEEYNEVDSDSDNNFIYKVGEIVEVKDFDDDRWNECSIGIHFFITRDEAIRYYN